MTIYVISNAHQLTEEIINDIKKEIKKDDIIVLMNRMIVYKYFKGMDNQIISFHRIMKSGYKGYEELKNTTINNLVIFTRNHRIKEDDEKFQEMIKNRDPSPSRITYIKDPFMKFQIYSNYPKGMKPTMGPIILLYLDCYYPDQEKVFVGFSSHSSQKNKEILTHDYKFERKFMIRYGHNKNVKFRYSILENNELIDKDFYEYYRKLSLNNEYVKVDQTFFSKEIYLI